VDPVAFGSIASRSVRLGRGCHLGRFVAFSSLRLVLSCWTRGVGLARSWSARVVSVIGHVGMRINGSPVFTLRTAGIRGRELGE
jgi:hypothetical protein